MMAIMTATAITIGLKIGSGGGDRCMGSICSVKGENWGRGLLYQAIYVPGLPTAGNPPGTGLPLSLLPNIRR